MDTNNNGKTVHFVKCPYPGCNDQSLRRVRTYCREHAVIVFLNPLNKQERELLSALDILQTNKKRVLAELSAVESEHSGERLLCHVCGGFSTKGWLALEQHQLYCKGKKKKGASKPRSPKQIAESEAFDEEMTDEE